MKTKMIVAFFMLFFPWATVRADVTVSFGSGPNQFTMGVFG